MSEEPTKHLWKIVAHPSHFAVMRDAVRMGAGGEDRDVSRAASKLWDLFDEVLNPDEAFPEPTWVPKEMTRKHRIALFKQEVPHAVFEPLRTMEAVISQRAKTHLEKCMETIRPRIMTASWETYDAACQAIEAAVKVQS